MMGERELYKQLKQYFVDHPRMPFEEFTAFAKGPYVEAQGEFIEPYQPIAVPKPQRDFSNYDAGYQEVHNKSLHSSDLHNKAEIARHRRPNPDDQLV